MTDETGDKTALAVEAEETTSTALGGEDAVTDSATEVKEESDAPQGAPEAYEDFTVPEGYDIDSEQLKQFSEIARELNLTQEHAQRLVDFEAERVAKLHESKGDVVADMRAEWSEQAHNDREIGGANYDESLAFARQALKAVGTPELYNALELTGTGDHPEFIRVFSKIGREVAEGRLDFGKGNPTPETSRDPAKTLYPNMN
tara:strand:- start:1230 stop:1835 length:606 start_codon:yes stop_codon:yes gene_type:complete